MIIEISRGTFFTSLVFLTVAFVPVLSAMMLIMIPLPVIYYFHKLGRGGGFLILAVSLIIVGAAQQAAGASFSITVFVILGALGFIISELFRKRITAGWTVTAAATAGLLVLGGLISADASWQGKFPWEHIYTYIYAMVQENIRLYAQLDLPADQLQFIKENAEKIARALTYAFPSLAWISVAAIVIINIIPAGILFKMRGLDTPEFGPLSRWKASDHLVWFLIGAGAGILAPWNAVKIGALNALIVCLFVYLIQGLAIVEFFFQKKRVSLFLRILFYFLIVIQQYLLLFVIAVGLFDLWIDFRKLQTPAKNLDQSP